MTQVKAKRRLSDIKFEHEGAHVALVLSGQGGPANGVTTLITKSTSDITDQQVETQLKLIEKAKFMSEQKYELTEVVREAFGSEYGWLCVEDFSEDTIVFSTDGGMFTVGYSLSSDGEYVVEDTATGVEWKSILIENGNLKLSADAQSKLNEGVYSLVTKALNNPETKERVNKTLKTILEKENMEIEVQIKKAVETATSPLTEKITALEKALEAANSALKEVEEQKKAALLKSREEAIAAFDKDGATELVKATASLSDEEFAVLTKSLGLKHQALAESDLMSQKSDPGAKSVEETNTTAEIIKARYATK